jgi:precorrin-6Y C5,15-methyltransferase (decarboxylating)
VANEDKVYIIGIGDSGLEGLTVAARNLLEKADLLIGDEQTLATLPAGRAQRLVVRTDLDEAVERIETGKKQRIVVLALGDPLFYGMARYLCDKLGKDRFEVIPHVSSMQLALPA